MDRRALDRSLAYVNSWLSWRCPRAGIPGCVVAVSYKDTILLEGAYGHADLEASRPLRADDVFRIASHSKSFTATVIMQLVEEGALRLDDAAANHAPWLQDHTDHRARAVTLRQLLSHGAGLLRDGLDSDHWKLSRRFPNARQLREEILGSELVTEPNVALKYSNIGYGLLGMVIEEVTGRSYLDYVSEHVVETLGLASTVPELYGPAPPGFAERSVTGYTRADATGTRQPIPPVDTRALAAATGFAGTAADLCRYYTAHFCGSGKLLTDESKREMQRVHFRIHRPGPGGDAEYGLGFVLQQLGCDGRRVTIGHGGGFPGQITCTIADPAAGIVVVVLTNCIDGPAAEIARGIYGVLDHFQEATEGRRGSAPPARRGLRQIEGRYVDLWAARDVVVSDPAGEHVVAACPDSWQPFADADLLEVVDNRTLRIADASGYGSAGELVHFEVADGAVKGVRWAGASLLPETLWPAAERALLKKAARDAGTRSGSRREAR